MSRLMSGGRWRVVSRRAAILGAVAIVTLPWGSAKAQDADLSVPLTDQIDVGTAQGEVVELTRVSSGDLAGATCSVTATRGDRDGAHPDNNLLLTSGDAELELDDVDREPNAVTTVDEPMRLDATVVIELEMGPAEEYSGDVELTFDCDPPPPERTTTTITNVAEAASEPAAESDTDTSPGKRKSNKTARRQRVGTTAPTSPAPEPEVTELPDTGSETTWALAFSVAFIAGGGLLRRIARRPEGVVQ